MIEMLIEARRRDLGGFEVGRVLPFAKHRAVGPFVFFDHMGPLDMPAGVPIQKPFAGGPASNSNTRIDGSSERRRATTEPAEPAPTTM